MLSFRRDFAPQFFAPSLYILYAADFNYLIRWVIVTLLLDISQGITFEKSQASDESLAKNDDLESRELFVL